MNHVEKIVELLGKSYSAFHAVKNIKEELLEAGFIQLDEKDNYNLELGKNYFVTRNDTSILAFKLPEKLKDYHMQLTATHNDSPTFKIKPNPVKKVFNLLQLNTEPYGGLIMNTWFDKPLSFAGRVLVKNGNKIESHLLSVDQDLLIIPNVCIHMNREINSGYKYNAAVDTLPIMGEWEEDFDFNQYLLEQLGLSNGQVLSFDLFLYNREQPRLIGRNKEFLSCGRLDDLSAAYSTLFGFVESEGKDHISVYASFDNEEVGSLTKQGANSTFLQDNLKRIILCLGGSKDDFQKAKIFFRPFVDRFDPDDDYTRHINMHYGEWVVEIHANQHCSFSVRVNKVMDEIHRDLFYGGNVRSWNNGYIQVFIPSPDNDVLIVFVHFLNHFFRGGVGGRQICDWCRLLWIYRNSLNMVLLESRIREMGLMNVWKGFAAFAVVYLGMPIEAMPFYSTDKNWKRKADRICSFILEVGNFGHNRDSSYYDNDSKLFRKSASFGRRCGDMLRHTKIFPFETLRFFPNMVYNGLVAVARGE